MENLLVKENFSKIQCGGELNVLPGTDASLAPSPAILKYIYYEI